MLKIPQKILVLGGSGYIGQRIVHRLHAEGHALRVMTRRPHMASAWLPHAEIVCGDAMSDDDLIPAMRDISHVVVCIRPKKDMHAKSQANLAMHILHSAVRVGVTHLTWIASDSPSVAPLKKILRGHEARIRILLLQSGPVLGSGSLAETAHQRLVTLPHWMLRHHRGQRMVSIDRLLTVVSRALRESRKGHLTLPKKAVPSLPQPHRGRMKSPLKKLKMALWLFVTRLPYPRGAWLYAQMSGSALRPQHALGGNSVSVDPPAFTPDTHITWAEALPTPQRPTWTEMPCRLRPTQQRWVHQHLQPTVPLKPGQYRHRCRLVYQQEDIQVWHTQWRYPFGLRIVIAKTVSVSIMPAGFWGWGMGKILAFFLR